MAVDLEDGKTLADEAQAILDQAGGDESLPGLEAEAKVSILGTAFATSDKHVLGERVEYRVVGYVKFLGDELIENEGKRRVVKVASTLIERVENAES